MTENKQLSIFPDKHIKPFDGMSITAEIWDKAHTEHRQALKAHELSLHGIGIIQGLEVIANDPADQLVFITAGAAVDSEGNIVVLEEPVAYDFSESPTGNLFLVIGHGEREVGGVDNEARYIQDEFVVAALPSMPKRPAVEIARINIEQKDKPITNAKDATHPGVGELDLRYRREIFPMERQHVRIGLINLGGKADDVVAFGWDQLGKESLRSSNYKLIVDTSADVIKNLEKYDIVYLSGKGNFKVSKTDLDALKKHKNPLILEALDDKGIEACQQLLNDLGVKPKAVDSKSILLESPFLFATPPAGSQEGEVLTSDKLVFSSAAYSLLWAGKQEAGTPTRSDIRSAHEWGINTLAYLLNKK
ncbi:hypothetical protein KQH54_02100 [bacterium]|nr:hypothetical protein [bacterium]